MRKICILITKLIAELVLVAFVIFFTVSCVGMLYVICTTAWSEMTLSQGILSGFSDVFLGTVCGYFAWLLSKAMKKVWRTNSCEELFS